MKIKTLAVHVTAGLAFCGLFAPAAGAEEVKEFSFCGPMEPAIQAWYSDPSRPEREVLERWEVDKHRYCAFGMVPPSKVHEAAREVGACIAEHVDMRDNLRDPVTGEGIEPWSKADLARVEDCIAAWEKGTTVERLRKQRGGKKKHTKKRPSKAPRSPAQSEAEAALAR